ncbi:MAG: class I SAM-dependent methyltransferase [Candidatus Sericytochromatia bacterium]|nr:class I SAM-dependent methyltransferase [Candidatus Tanganyikabacteria bacterium]
MHHAHHSHHATAAPPRKADIRDPAGSIDPEEHLWSQWRSPALIAHGPAATAAFVLAQVGDRPARVLEMGCGTGYLALELARRGHAVLAVDPSEESLGCARHTAALVREEGGALANLRYDCAAFGDWDPPAEAFDTIVFNQSLHHIPDLAATVARARRLLRSGGKVVVCDFVYDRLDEPTAAWLAEMQDLAGLAGAERGDPAPDPAQSRRDLAQQWREKAESHELRGHVALLSALREAFRETAFSWEPYLYTRIANHAPPSRHATLVPWLQATERLRIAEVSIASLCYRFVGLREP